LRIGISACLLGQTVRYDGGHKYSEIAARELTRWATLIEVCPEVDAGLGVPRPPVEIHGSRSRQRLVTVAQPRTDHTQALVRASGKRIKALSTQGISGFVLKRKSPSCGVTGVWARSAGRTYATRGLFTTHLLRAMPELPVIEEHQIVDPRHREWFFEAIVAWYRVAAATSGRWHLDDLRAFHHRSRMLLWAYNPAAPGRLGRLLAPGQVSSRHTAARRYRQAFARTLARSLSRKRHGDVLREATTTMSLRPAARRDLLSAVAAYRRGELTRPAVAALIRHRAALAGHTDLAGQTYLQPHPSAT
jgi:uncharacterized protein YbbK (DUF523 family)/uncharacterized protein YbgA (DUF1722 family)